MELWGGNIRGGNVREPSGLRVSQIKVDNPQCKNYNEDLIFLMICFFLIIHKGDLHFNFDFTHEYGTVKGIYHILSMQIILCFIIMLLVHI